jgi:hypothetical protein
VVESDALSAIVVGIGGGFASLKFLSSVLREVLWSTFDRAVSGSRWKIARINQHIFKPRALSKARVTESEENFERERRKTCFNSQFDLCFYQ